ncbi:MAG: phosphoribosylformylglycinamidine synthase subunit PurS [Saprospirales bacterium]|nr:MAG: phosphoribosylformylglycinamidine synthase subunit PurS [Saprospirales bacterium]
MQQYKASVKIMPHSELLDPQGKTVGNNLKNLDIHAVEDVRIGKFIELTLGAKSEEEAREKVEKACKKLLANLIMEQYEYELKAV